MPEIIAQREFLPAYMLFDTIFLLGGIRSASITAWDDKLITPKTCISSFRSKGCSSSVSSYSLAGKPLFCSAVSEAPPSLHGTISS